MIVEFTVNGEVVDVERWALARGEMMILVQTSERNPLTGQWEVTSTTAMPETFYRHLRCDGGTRFRLVGERHPEVKA